MFHQGKANVKVVRARLMPQMTGREWAVRKEWRSKKWTCDNFPAISWQFSNPQIFVNLLSDTCMRKREEGRMGSSEEEWRWREEKYVWKDWYGVVTNPRVSFFDDSNGETWFSIAAQETTGDDVCCCGQFLVSWRCHSSQRDTNAIANCEWKLSIRGRDLMDLNFTNYWQGWNNRMKKTRRFGLWWRRDVGDDREIISWWSFRSWISSFLCFVNWINQSINQLSFATNLILPQPPQEQEQQEISIVSISRANLL
jgi:hypothetical protein